MHQAPGAGIRCNPNKTKPAMDSVIENFARADSLYPWGPEAREHPEVALAGPASPFLQRQHCRQEFFEVRPGNPAGLARMTPGAGTRLVGVFRFGIMGENYGQTPFSPGGYPCPVVDRTCGWKKNAATHDRTYIAELTIAGFIFHGRSPRHLLLLGNTASADKYSCGPLHRVGPVSSGSRSQLCPRG